jgi:sugar phosphate permease
MPRQQTRADEQHAVEARMRRARWTTFALVVSAYVLSFFHRVAPATVANDLQQAFHASAAALGGLAATYFYVYTLMQIPTGILVDTLGPRRILTLGGVVAGVGALLFGYADSLTDASIGRLLVGLGVSVTFIAMLKLNAAWFHDRHFGTSVGLAILLGNVGAVLAATPLAAALQYVSWRTVFAAIGLLSIVLAAITWFFVRNHPGEAGLPSMRELDGKTAHLPHEGHWLAGLLTVLRNRATWPGFWVNLGSAGSFFAFAGLWAVPYLRDVHGMERGIATQHTSMLLAGFAIGALSVGTLSDRLGRRRPVLIAAGLVYLLCWLPLVFAVDLPRLLSYSLFLFMGLGAASFTLSWACVKEVNKHSLSGMATSVVNTGAFLGAGILQPLVGWVIDRASAEGGVPSYQAGMWILFGFVVLGFAGGLRIRETYCRYVEH